MKKIITLLGIIGCLSCGGVDDSLFVDGGGGVGSHASYLTTSSSTGGSSSSSSSSSSTSSTSSGCVPKVTCQSVGAECGTISDDGCGDFIDCGNNCSAPLTCGGGGQQFKCGCTPKTCFQLGKNCGSTDDGCGTFIDCGSCDPNKYQTFCGDWKVGNGMLLPPSPNVCGGGCGIQNGIPDGDSDCKQNAGHPIEWVCDSNAIPTSPIPPSINCVLAYSNNNTIWCCQ